MADPKDTEKKTDQSKDTSTAPVRNKANAKRATAAVDAEALYPLPPDNIDEKKVKVLAEADYGAQMVRVVTDGKSTWKEIV